MAKTIIIPETELVTHIKKFIDECDADELGRIAGEIFGGECFMLPGEGDVFDNIEYYKFEPDQNYFGEFGEFTEGTNG